MPGFGGMLCVADGDAPAPNPGFVLNEIRAYNVAGATAPSASDVAQYGRSLTFDVNRHWSANAQLMAYFTPTASPAGVNTLAIVSKYSKSGMPILFDTKLESVTYRAVSVNSCPAFASAPLARPIHVASSCDQVPDSKIGNTYVYKNVPTTCGGLGVRLMKDRHNHPLHASEIQIAVVKADWTPQLGVELNLHRPVGTFEVGALPSDPVTLRFPSKHRHSIVLFQPSVRVAHTLLSQTAKVPDGFSLYPFLDIHVMVNDLDFAAFYADNDGTYDLWVRVVKP